jgi:hypothetical protein
MSATIELLDRIANAIGSAHIGAPWTVNDYPGSYTTDLYRKHARAVLDVFEKDFVPRVRFEELEIELEECKHQNGISDREIKLEAERDALRDALIAVRGDIHSPGMEEIVQKALGEIVEIPLPVIEGLTDGHSFEVQTAPTNTPGDDAAMTGGSE